MMNKVENLLGSSEKVCLLIKNTINTTTCDELLCFAQSNGFDKALDKYPSTYRNNQRLQLDSDDLAEKIFEACRKYFPENLEHHSVLYELDSLNSRLRFCEYQKDQWFKIHQDGEYRPSPEHCSKLTFLLYLNDATEFEGGNTNFYSDQYGIELLASYSPKKGDLLVFSHDIWHSGENVESGSKYILRSDVIYKKDITKHQNHSHHDGYIWKIHSLDEEHFVTVSRDKKIKIWDKELICQQSLDTHVNSVLDIAHDKERNLYSVSRDGFISKWSLQKDCYKLNFKIDSGHPTILSINIFDKQFVTTGSDGKLRKFDLEGKFICESREHCDWNWKLIKYQNSYITCNTDGYLYFWDIDTLALIRKIAISCASLTCLTLYKHSIYLGLITGELVQFDLLTNSIFRTYKPHKASIRDIKLDRFANIYTCAEDNLVKKISPKTSLPETINTHAGFVTSLMLVENKIYSVSYDGMIICTTTDALLLGGKE